MCTNVKQGAHLDLPEAEVRRRLQYVRSLGFLRIVLTGGEPLALQPFEEAIRVTTESGMVWDLLTNACLLASEDTMARLLLHPPRLVIASFHSHRPEVARAIAGGVEGVADASTAGIRNLVTAGIPVLLHCVLNRLNLDHLHEIVAYSAEHFGPRTSILFSLPLLDARDPDWPALDLRLSEVRGIPDMLFSLGAMSGVSIFFQAFPACVVGPEIRPLSRADLGTTHYLDDASGNIVFSQAEADSYNFVFGDRCLPCRAFTRCSGIQRRYALKNGFGEVRPF